MPKKKTLDGKQVFEFLNQIAVDEEHQNEVTVLPFMCGSGKSTAISYKIRDVIEKAEATGEGLLIVTDRTDRMADYLHPHDRELEAFLAEHEDQVTVMTHKNVGEAYSRQFYTPVLMMTTQRYFRLTVEEINKLLKWKQGRRPLILFDERPELVTIVTLDAKKLSDCLVAVNNSSRHLKWAGFGPDFTIKRAKEAFSYFSEILYEIETGEKNFYCFWSWMEKSEKENLWRILDEDYHEYLKEKNRINSFGGEEYYEDIHTKIRAIFEMAYRNILFCRKKRISDKSYYDYLSVLLDNNSLVNDVNAKAIILDSTAELTPEYAMNRYHCPETAIITRRLDNLRIKLINIPAGKTRLANDKEYRRYISDCVKLYFDEKVASSVNDESQWAIFCHTELEYELQKRFNEERIEHFGNIKGKNDYRDAKHILQIGVNRFPDDVYYLYYLQHHPDIASRFENMQFALRVEKGGMSLPLPECLVDVTEETRTTHDLAEFFGGNDKYLETSMLPDEPSDPPDGKKLFDLRLDKEKILSQAEIIERQMRDNRGEMSRIMNALLLAEIEQNLFRGTIRNSDSEEVFTFHLFINTTRYADLIRLMHQRYDKLGAVIETEELPLNTALRKLINRKGESYAKAFIRWHDEVLETGETYTPQRIREAIGLTGENGIRTYEQMIYQNKQVLRLLMTGEQKLVGGKPKKGVYVKKGNWMSNKPL